jgi:transposase
MNAIQDMFSRDEYKSSRPHPIGRPPKLNLEMIEQICDLIIDGFSLAKAAVITGVSESTIYRWLAMGKKQDSESIYIELVQRIQEATECSELEFLQRMRIAAQSPQNWRVNVWLLERRFPEKYGKRSEKERVNTDKIVSSTEATVLTAV